MNCQQFDSSSRPFPCAANSLRSACFLSKAGAVDKRDLFPLASSTPQHMTADPCWSTSSLGFLRLPSHLPLSLAPVSLSAGSFFSAGSLIIGAFSFPPFVCASRESPHWNTSIT